MNYRPKLQLPPPANWQDFETLCWGLWKAIWGNDKAQKNGRQGQPQNGVDIYGQPKSGSGWEGVQCKGKENFTDKKLTKAEVTKEVKKAKTFNPRLQAYTIATTAPKDVAMQEHARNLTDRHRRTGWFSVAVCGWDDIEDLLYEHEPQVAGQFYPLVFGGELGALLGKMLDRLPEPSGAAYILPTTSNFVAEVPEGALAKQAFGYPSVAPQSSCENQLRAKDIRRVLPFLTSVQEELQRKSGVNDASSSDVTLASAVDRAAGSSRDASSSTGKI